MEQTEKPKPDLSRCGFIAMTMKKPEPARRLRVVLLGTVLILVAAALLVGYRMWGTANMPEVEVARAIVESGVPGSKFLPRPGISSPIARQRSARRSPAGWNTSESTPAAA